MSDYRKDLETLESLVDSHGLSAVVCMLSEICTEKAEHLRANWQDTPSAKPWAVSSNRLANVKFPPFPWQ